MQGKKLDVTESILYLCMIAVVGKLYHSPSLSLIQRRPSILGENGDTSLTQPIQSGSGQPFTDSLTTHNTTASGAASSGQPLVNMVTTATSTPASVLG